MPYIDEQELARMAKEYFEVSKERLPLEKERLNIEQENMPLVKEWHAFEKERLTFEKERLEIEHRKDRREFYSLLLSGLALVIAIFSVYVSACRVVNVKINSLDGVPIQPPQHTCAADCNRDNNESRRDKNKGESAGIVPEDTVFSH